MTTVVFAPDSFKGSAPAAEVANALCLGWRDVRPYDTLVALPMADGGEGTVDAISAALPTAVRRSATVTGPDGRPAVATWLRIEQHGVATAIVELASASGLTLLKRPEPLTAHTIGLGQVMRAAIESGVDRLMVGLGGSASTDVGLGALVGLGARLLDGAGREVPPGNGTLDKIASVDWHGAFGPPRGGAVVMSDVRTPLLGPAGAVAVFGAQKGIPASGAAAAEARVARAAALISRTRGGNPSADGAGAAGGAGFGLVAWGATIVGGAQEVGRMIGLEAACATADVVVTGEGRYDGQSRHGKVPHHVLEIASARGLPTLLVAGDIRASPREFAASASLADLAGGLSAAMAEPTRWLREAGRALAHATPAAA